MDAPHLPASRCPECSTYSFPRYQGRCTNSLCSRERDVEDVELGREGYLWSFTRVLWPRGVRRPAGVAELYTAVAIQLVEERLLIIGLAGSNVDCEGLVVGQSMQMVRSFCLEPASIGMCIGEWRPVACPLSETSCEERLA